MKNIDEDMREGLCSRVCSFSDVFSVLSDSIYWLLWSLNSFLLINRNASYLISFHGDVRVLVAAHGGFI